MFQQGNYEHRDPSVVMHHLAGKRRLVKDYPTVMPQTRLKGLGTYLTLLISLRRTGSLVLQNVI